MKFYGYFLFYFLFLTLGCKPKPSDEMPTETIPLRYLALGDSYTIGEGVPEQERWPVLLANAINTAATYHLLPPTIVAQTGWTTAELETALQGRQDLGGGYDLVSLLIGVNNQYRGQDIWRYEEELNRLLSFATAQSDRGAEGVFVVSIPDYAFTPFGGRNPAITKGVNAFNAVARARCSALGIPFLDITPLSRSAPDDPTWLAADRLHPSGLQYRSWVEAVILPGVTPLLPN